MSATINPQVLAGYGKIWEEKLHRSDRGHLVVLANLGPTDINFSQWSKLADHVQSLLFRTAVEVLFTNYLLPEVSAEDVRAETLTNLQMAEALNGDLIALEQLLSRLGPGSLVKRRALLSARIKTLLVTTWSDQE